MYTYRCTLDRVIDGDTVDVHIDLGFGVWLKSERVRITGIDAPEVRTRDDIEKVFGFAAKDRVEELFAEADTVTLLSHDFKGKFGRILGDFVFSSHADTLGNILLAEGHAVVYDDDNRDKMDADHIANRAKLLAEGKVTLPG